MILRNKKTGQRITVTREQFDNLKQVGFARSWDVISNQDETEPEVRKVLPEDIINFSKIKKTKKKHGNT